jgi:hypothetical protein
VKFKKTDEIAFGIAYKSGVVGIFFLCWSLEIYL